MTIAPGTILAEKYRVDRLLGEGGMGIVVAATHLALNQQIAVKLLRPEAMANPSLIERFEREARAAARVHGEHVARVIDVGKLPGGLPFIVMEYLEGEDLERALERRGPLPIGETIDYLLQACEAVGEAHAANIVHRDLKPANLFLARRANDDAPTLKVLDFGISKILEPETDAITKTSSLMGTAYYMSPEQLTSAKKVDTRTDLWALGVILYELLTGKRPFEAATMPEVVALILENAPVPLTTLRPDVPAELEEIVRRCLRRADERTPTVADLATALAPFAPPHALPLVARVNKLVTAAGSLSSASRTQSTNPPSGQQLRIAVDPHALSQGETAVGVTQVQDEMVVAKPVAANRNVFKWIGTAVAALAIVGGLVVLKSSPHDGNTAEGTAGSATVASSTAAYAGNSAASAAPSSASNRPAASAAPSASTSPATSAAPSASASPAESASTSRVATLPSIVASAPRDRPRLVPTGRPVGSAAPSSSARANPLEMGIQ